MLHWDLGEFSLTLLDILFDVVFLAVSLIHYLPNVAILN